LQIHNGSLPLLKQTELARNAESLAYPSTGKLGSHCDIDLLRKVEQQSAAPDDSK
jgi:hypothetical protein